MKRFIELTKIEAGRSVGEQQRLADEEFAAVAAANGLRAWRPGDSIPADRDRVLVGVATYSVADMELLDRVASCRADDGGREMAVDVFHVRDVRAMDGFEEFIHGIGRVFQTPVVGLWKGGKLVQSFSGKAGLEAVLTWVGSGGDARDDTSLIGARRRGQPVR